jgi:cation transport ATPase
MAPLARVVHALPGRKRLKIEEKRGDEAYFDAVEKALSDSPGVLRVETNYRTGSVVVHHRPDEPSALQRAEEQGQFQLATKASEAPPGAFSAPSVAANATATRKTSRPKPNAARADRANLRPLIIMGWMGLGIAQAMEGNIAIPAMAAFWYAYLVSQENGVSNAELG